MYPANGWGINVFFWTVFVFPLGDKLLTYHMHEFSIQSQTIVALRIMFSSTLFGFCITVISHKFLPPEKAVPTVNVSYSQSSHIEGTDVKESSKIIKIINNRIRGKVLSSPNDNSSGLLLITSLNTSVNPFFLPL